VRTHVNARRQTTKEAGERKDRGRDLLNGVYEFTVNFGFDLFTNMFLVQNGASVDLK
jgi:hypothetical protein